MKENISMSHWSFHLTVYDNLERIKYVLRPHFGGGGPLLKVLRK